MMPQLGAKFKYKLLSIQVLITFYSCSVASSCLVVPHLQWGLKFFFFCPSNYLKLSKISFHIYSHLDENSSKEFK